MNQHPTHYHPDTPADVCQFIESALTSRHSQRYEITYGDRTTGRSWGDTHSGYIGRSTGWEPIPLLIHNARCYGGPGLLDDCIVRIRTARGKHTIWQHPTFQEEH